jgi:hypothetical protein
LNPRRRWAWLVAPASGFLCRGTTSGTPSHQLVQAHSPQDWQGHLI